MSKMEECIVRLNEKIEVVIVIFKDNFKKIMIMNDYVIKMLIE